MIRQNIYTTGLTCMQVYLKSLLIFQFKSGENLIHLKVIKK